MMPNPGEYLTSELQKLRDYADEECLKSSNLGDRDSADALETIGVRIADCLHECKHDLHVVRERMGLRSAY